MILAPHDFAESFAPPRSQPETGTTPCPRDGFDCCPINCHTVWVQEHNGAVLNPIGFSAKIRNCVICILIYEFKFCGMFWELHFQFEKLVKFSMVFFDKHKFVEGRFNF